MWSPGDREGWLGRSCGHGVTCCMGRGGGTGTPWCPRMGFGGVPGWRGAVPRAPAALPPVLGGLSIPSHPQVGPRDGGTLGGDPWGAAGWTHGRRHGRGRAGLCPPPRSPQMLWPCPGAQGGCWVLPAPWGWHRGASVAVMGHGDHLGCRGPGGPQMWVLSGDRAHSQPPQPGLNPCPVPAWGGLMHPPSTPVLGGTAGAGGSPPNPLSAGKGCPFGATPAWPRGGGSPGGWQAVNRVGGGDRVPPPSGHACGRPRSVPRGPNKRPFTGGDSPAAASAPS